jgi:lipid-binding SYLF domain-containing protein
MGNSALAASASEINRNATQALTTLYQTTPGAEALADKSKGILVFPNIVKGGFIIAGQYGDGALRKKGRTVGYYRSIEASVGFQAGAQAFGYVLFFMDNDSRRYLDKSGGGSSERDRHW